MGLLLYIAIEFYPIHNYSTIINGGATMAAAVPSTTV